MAIKAIIDSARALHEYAGLGIFSGDEPLFLEHIELDYALRLKSLYGRVCGKTVGPESLCAVAGGFTFHISDDSGLTILVRLAGRFSSRPRLVQVDSDYVDPLSSDILPSRDEIRREAEALLRQYDLLG